MGSVSASRAAPRMQPWTSTAHGRSEYLRLRNVVDALVRIAEHAGDTGPFLDEATATVMELTRATGAVVLTAARGGLQVRSARGQMKHIEPAAFDAGHTLAPACLRSHEAMHSSDVEGDDRVRIRIRKGRAIRSLICTPLRYGDDVLGVLEVCSSVVHAFDDIDAQAVALIGNALGGALGRQLELDQKARLLARLEAALQTTRAQATWVRGFAKATSSRGWAETSLWCWPRVSAKARGTWPRSRMTCSTHWRGHALSRASPSASRPASAGSCTRRERPHRRCWPARMRRCMRTRSVVAPTRRRACRQPVSQTREKTCFGCTSYDD